MKKVTLTPSYATPNTVCFKEDGGEITDELFAASTSNAFLGSMYLKAEQLTALGWQATSVGQPYETEADRRGKTYTRRDVTGPNIEVSIKVTQ